MKGRALFAFALLVAVLVVFAVHALDFPGSVPDFVRSSGGGVLLDVKPSFDEEAIYRRIEAYGQSGRSNYAFRNRTVDVVLPLAVFPALFLLMLRAVGHFPFSRVLRVLLYSLSLVYVIFDFAENWVVLALLEHFPERMPLLAGGLPYLTMIKRVASLLALAVPLVLFVVAGVRSRSAKG